MKKQLYNLILALLFIPIAANANDIGKFKHEKSKSIKKEYSVNADATLKVDNRYGNVDVISWNENRIVIEVKITVRGDNEEKVLDKLDRIDIEFEGSRSLVYAKTIIDKNKSSWSWNWGRKSNVNYEINYRIKVPITNNANLINDYGSISLNELKGDASINCDYGKIIIGELHSINNKINIDYTNNSTVGYMKGGSINADYSKFTIEEAGNVKLNADYTTSIFEKINDLTYNCDYGSLTIDEASSVIGNGDYLSAKLGTIAKTVKIDADYGSIKIENLRDGFESVDISTSYAGIKIGIPKNSSFNFELQLSYAGFIGDSFSQGEQLAFTGIPNFAPELFRRAQLKDPLKMKALLKGLTQLCEEGATQLFRPLANNDLILGAVGILQFDVVAHRLKDEYGVDCQFEAVNVNTARWVSSSDNKKLEEFKVKLRSNLALDHAGDLAYIAPSRVNLTMTQERWPEIEFLATREHGDYETD